MGLDMQTKRKITAVTAKRYRTADRKGKTAILNEFTTTTGYNRTYALRILANWDRSRLTRVEWNTVKLKAARRKRKAGGGRPKVYSGQAVAVLETIGGFEGYSCGKILAQILRNQTRFSLYNFIRIIYSCLRDLIPSARSRVRALGRLKSIKPLSATTTGKQNTSP